jgi:hypothetical protein
MKLLKFKRPAAESDEAIYKRLALAFRECAVWPTNALRIASFSYGDAVYSFYVFVPKGRS